MSWPSVVMSRSAAKSMGGTGRPLDPGSGSVEPAAGPAFPTTGGGARLVDELEGESAGVSPAASTTRVYVPLAGRETTVWSPAWPEKTTSPSGSSRVKPAATPLLSTSSRMDWPMLARKV